MGALLGLAWISYCISVMMLCPSTSYILWPQCFLYFLSFTGEEMGGKREQVICIMSGTYKGQVLKIAWGFSFF